MEVLDVDILFYDEILDAYWVKYLLTSKKGVLRRTKSIYFCSTEKLARDSNNTKLLDKIKGKILLYNKMKKE